MVGEHEAADAVRAVHVRRLSGERDLVRVRVRVRIRVTWGMVAGGLLLLH